MEIFREESGPKSDPDGQIIRAEFLSDGSLKIEVLEYGKSARKFSGHGLDEYGHHISAEHVPALTLALLHRSFNLRGQIGLSTFEKICKNAGIPIEFSYLRNPV